MELSHGCPDLADDHADDDEVVFVRMRRSASARTGLLVTLFINWVVKPSPWPC